MNDITPWLVLAGLGAYHGLNPGMGWLFAVSVGLQERRRAAVVRALGPIALGHAVSIAVVVLLVAALGVYVDTSILSLVCGVALFGFGLYKLLVPLSHPRWVGMRVNRRDLVAWSFLMATAHGAGLMLVPVLVRSSDSVAETAHHSHAGHQMAGDQMVTSSSSLLPATETLTVLVHTGAMYLVMGVVAVLVYQWIGLGILRKGWLNLDRLWAVLLIAAGALTVSL